MTTKAEHQAQMAVLLPAFIRMSTYMEQKILGEIRHLFYIAGASLYLRRHCLPGDAAVSIVIHDESVWFFTHDRLVYQSATAVKEHILACLDPTKAPSICENIAANLGGGELGHGKALELLEAMRSEEGRALWDAETLAL